MSHPVTSPARDERRWTLRFDASDGEWFVVHSEIDGEERDGDLAVVMPVAAHEAVLADSEAWQAGYEQGRREGLAAARQVDDRTRFRVAEAARDWIHHQPFSECGPGADTCPDWPMAAEITKVVLAALTVPEPEEKR